MNSNELVFYLKQALYLVFWLSLPLLGVASVVGTLFSLFQALTQIQEQTLSFAIKLVAVFATLLLTAGWIGSEIFNYSLSVYGIFRTIR
ncbi:EscS/YscS/HrcS family type III secretion system export apparatus protein [Bordetella genomosp. 9]|uniref:EscS/YscS/HrcS family type III secretion system export apparatus protein n=2 Tax=Bordetella genomosp. 9 TaxID=1416803 RepID=A0A1W6Z5A6_9BORD|nr:type III secretion system export apparatus subunit SctS [Bordetella genomosp. 9]ARP88542.1 EscS/YscS/HrcS family type III secretion system export apparatus protein [Bordetella genomosp. 9]ARP92506.1 EscS/YscS/HrcS family type III secretion system export apparatus protein [Bordetella genomosp. 9]